MHRCRAAKYFVLLLAMLSIKHYERVSVFLPQLPRMKITPILRRVMPPSLVCLAVSYLPHYLINGTILVWNIKCIVISLQLLSAAFLIVRRIQRYIIVTTPSPPTTYLLAYLITYLITYLLTHSLRRAESFLRS